MSKDDNKMENQEPVIITYNGTEYRASDLNEEQISIYPIPANDAITIEAFNLPGSEAAAYLYNTTGLLVKSESISLIDGVGTLNVCNVDSGIYILVLKSADELYLIKYIIVH